MKIINALALVLLAGCSSARLTMAPPREMAGKKIAVLGFQSDPREEAKCVARMVSDEITTALPTFGYKVIERAQLDNVIGEQKQVNNGFTDIEQAVKIGRMAGADYVVVGSLQGFVVDPGLGRASVEGTVYCRAVSVESGQVVWSYKNKMSKTDICIWKGIVGGESPVLGELAERFGQDISRAWERGN